MAPPAAPTTEVGTQSATGVTPWSGFVDDQERTAELQWPQSIVTYQAMRNDAQVEGLLRGSTLPIRRYSWFIDPNGADPDIVEYVARDMNLPIKGQEDKPRGRRKRRFLFDRHLFHALLALSYGHYYFEKVGYVDDSDLMWHLRKLGARPPYTITDIHAAPDGGLEYIQQMNISGVSMQAPKIEVNRLIAYVWDQEAGNWVGRSMLRSCYRNWLIKDREMRIDAINHERAGGIPTIEAPPDATPAQIKALDQMTQRYKVGEHAGGAVPNGAKLRFDGAKSPDVVASMKFHNEEMSRAFLMMFMQLGQTETGSRALGSEFIDYFELAQESVANWFRDTTNEHLIEDMVDWNYGEDVEQVPMLAYAKNDTADPVADLAKQQVNLPPEVQAAIDEHNARRSTSHRAKRRPRAVAAAEATSPLDLPDRALRRQPYAHEVQAQTNFREMDSAWSNTLDALVQDVRGLQAHQIDDLHDQIVAAAGDLKDIAAVQAEPLSADIIAASMQKAAESGIKTAHDEAKAQGLSMSKPKVASLLDNISARAQAVDTVLASGLSNAASAKALALSGGGLDDAEVADEVKSYLSGLSDRYLRDRLGGAVTQAQNSGRKLVARDAADEIETIYASELLDENTCGPCVGVDGTEYLDIDTADADYPTGGFMDCQGGERCRGTIVVVYKTEASASA